MIGQQLRLICRASTFILQYFCTTLAAAAPFIDLSWFDHSLKDFSQVFQIYLQYIGLHCSPEQKWIWACPLRPVDKEQLYLELVSMQRIYSIKGRGPAKKSRYGTSLKITTGFLYHRSPTVRSLDTKGLAAYFSFECVILYMTWCNAKREDICSYKGWDFISHSSTSCKTKVFMHLWLCVFAHKGCFLVQHWAQLPVSPGNGIGWGGTLS